MRRGCMNIGLLVVMVAGCCRTSKPAAKSPAPAAPPAAANAANPPVPQTAEGCRACNGDFGAHGLDTNPTCNCRTHDPGKRCLGKDDCESECIGDLGDREVTSPGPPAMGHWIGRCAEFRTTYGCHVFLPPHGAAPAPVPLGQAPDQLCVD